MNIVINFVNTAPTQAILLYLGGSYMNMRSSDRIDVKSTVLNAFMVGVFRWMTFGLMLTALVAFITMSSEPFMNLLRANFMVVLVLLFAELGLVLFLSARIAKLSSATASTLFLLYSALNGITIAPILFAYTGASVAATFFVCAGMFGAMSLYGMVTKKDLTSWGSFLLMGLIGIIIASLVNLFLRSGVVSTVITYLGVFIFLGLTAFDVQKLKVMGESMPENNPTVAQRGIILGALTLYLDFINLFLFLLRILGDRK